MLLLQAFATLRYLDASLMEMNPFTLLPPAATAADGPSAPTSTSGAAAAPQTTSSAAAPPPATALPTAFPLDMRLELDDTAAYRDAQERWLGGVEFPLPFGRTMSAAERYISDLDDATGKA